MDKKRTRGRQKIPIQRITNEGDCFATFSKRRLGLFKKASEICTLCNVDVGIMLFSPTGKPFSFFHPTMEPVINQFQYPNQQLDMSRRLSESFTRTRVVQLNGTLDNLRDELEVEKERENHLVQTNVTSGWWNTHVGEFNAEQTQQILTSLKDLQFQMRNFKNELTTQASTSSLQPVQNLSNAIMGVNHLPRTDDQLQAGHACYIYNAGNGERIGQNNQNGDF